MTSFAPVTGFNEVMHTRKRFNFIILFALLSYFLNVLIPAAYGQPLVFGPELFLHNQANTSRVVRSFSVKDVGREFILSVQSGGSSKKGIGRGTVEINGEVVASLDLGDQFKMLTKSVNLQRENDISVAMADGAGASILVSIMNQEEHNITAKVPPIGETVTLPGFASIVFPAGAFGQTQQEVMMSATASSSDIFETHTTGLRLPYEIRINTGNRAPGKDMRVDLNIPDSFYASQYQIQIFARMHDHSAAQDEQDRFILVWSSVNQALMTAKTMLSKQAFSAAYGKDRTYEAVLTIGLIPWQEDQIFTRIIHKLM